MDNDDLKTYAVPLKRKESCPVCGERYLEVASMKEENWRLKGIEDRLQYEIEQLKSSLAKQQEFLDDAEKIFSRAAMHSDYEANDWLFHYKVWKDGKRD